LIAIHRYFAALLIISGLLFKDFLNSEKNLLKILVYLLFFSIVSLLVMTDKAATESLGDYYYVFRLILILLIVVQSALEIKKSMQSE
jgi:branched-subunit amino acid permease